MKKTNLALQGIRVLDCSRIMAGPYCTMLLGDYGADVIKVEQPSIGDPTRQWGPPWLNKQSAYFLSCNRNKRSITIDLKTKDGQKIIKDLVKKSDVFIENFQVGYMNKLGLDYDALSQINPKLIYCSITGYGQTGPLKEDTGYDFMIQAQGGLMSITGFDEATKVGIPIVDISTGLNACNAILAALFFRSRTDEGQYIDCSLLDTQLALLTNVAQNYFVSKQDPQRYGNEHPNIVPYQTIQCADRRIALAIGNNEQFKRLATLLKSNQINQKKYSSNELRLKNRKELIQLIEDKTRTIDSTDLIFSLNKLKIPASRINSIPEIFNNEQIKNRNMIEQIEHPKNGIQSQIGHANKLNKSSLKIRYAPPELSEHTYEVLKGILNYSKSKISYLKKSKII